jgi:translocation and assembly module TamA
MPVYTDDVSPVCLLYFIGVVQRLLRGVLAISLMVMLSIAITPSIAQELLSSRLIIGAPLPVPEGVLKALNSPALEKQGVSGARLRYAAEDDSAVIREWLRSEGYLDTVVETEAGVDGAVVWHVMTGEIWHISVVNVAPPPPGDVILPKLGDVFRSADYEQAKTSLRGVWVDHGYLKAGFAEAKVIPDHQSKTVQILWCISPGQLFHISELQIKGAVQYDKTLVQRLSLLKVGQVPTARVIRNAIRNLTGDSHYKSIVVIPRMDAAEDAKVPIRIEVIEEPGRVLTGEVGYSTDIGLSAGANWLNRGAMKGNLEYDVHGLWSQATGGMGLAIARPAWPGVHDRVGVAFDYLREDTSGQRFNTISGGPFWRHDFALFDFMKLSVQQNWINGAGERLRLLEPEVQLHMDRRSGEGLPRSGMRLDVSLSFPLQTNGNGRWMRAKAGGRSYHAIGDWFLVAPRIGYGHSLSFQKSVPKALRQYTGGAGSVRGYKLDSIGSVGADGLATGGLHAGYAGMDLVIAPAKHFSPVLFSDIGKVWGTATGKESMAFSVGIGLIVGTPAGPVRLDIVKPLRRRAQDSGFQFYFSLGEVL